MIPRIFIILLFLVKVLLAAERPHILWITLEDTSPHFIGCYGNQDAKTPNIDALAARGVRFNRAFANAPVCSAARSAIIMGAINERMGTGHHRSSYPVPDTVTGFPAFLRAKGYYTTNNSKTDYSTSSANRIITQSWDESSRHAGWEKRKEGQPFFSVFNIDSCHQSRTMTWSYQWYRSHIFDKLSPAEQIADDAFAVPPFYPDTPELRKHFARIYNSISYADAEVGRILDRLETDGLSEDTIVFCYADHGEAMPRGKATANGLGYQVPFIISFPEKWNHLNPWGEKGTTTEELICFDDLGPTMLSLVGQKAAPWMTGRALLGEHRQSPRPYVFGSRNRIDENIGCVRSITDGRYLYTRNFMPGPGLPWLKYFEVGDLARVLRKEQGAQAGSVLFAPQPFESLHDLKEDRWEMTNILHEPQHRERVETLRVALLESIVKNGDVLLLPEFQLAEISKTTTPYAYGQAMSLEERKAILHAADLASRPEVEPEIIELLSSPNPTLQYWAASAFRMNRLYPRHLFKLADLTFPPARIEFATACYQYDQSQEGFAVLSEALLSESEAIRLHALQRVQELKSAGRPFVEILKKSAEGGTYNTQAAAEVALYRLGGPDISYPDPKW